jgi:peroxiredoxin
VRRTHSRIALLLPLLLLAACAKGPTPRSTNLVHPADLAPTFRLDTVRGEAFDLADQRGKVVLVNFFATWCPPCQEEMPHLKTRVWEAFAGEDFAMVSVAREEAADVVAPFMEKYGAAWPFALDVERTAFARYAEAFIPRNYVLDREGRVVFEGSGFEEDEFAHMVETIARELGR